jgi:PPOX class probable F420-dependent enzyme
MAQHMQREEWQAFLSEGTRTAKLATTRKNGRPHVVPVWFVLDGDDVLFTTHTTTVKGKALQRDGYVSLCVDDERPPFAFVLVEGRAEVSEDLDELLRWATVIASRYMGEDLAQEYGERNAVEGELLIRVHPERVVAMRNMAE